MSPEKRLILEQQKKIIFSPGMNEGDDEVEDRSYQNESDENFILRELQEEFR